MIFFLNLLLFSPRSIHVRKSNGLKLCLITADRYFSYHSHRVFNSRRRRENFLYMCARDECACRAK